MAAEAVIFFKRELAENFSQRRKRAGHLLSKGRFLGAQFVGWLEQGHWLELARHANNQAQKLSEALCSVSGVRLVQPTEANEVFVTMPKDMAAQLTMAGAVFYEWNLNALNPDTPIDPNDTFIRLVTSYSTQDEHISDLYAEAKNYANNC